MMPADDFGTLNAMLAFSTIVTVPCTILLYGSAKFTAKYMATDRPEHARYLTVVSLRFAVILGIATFVLLVIFRNFISSILNIKDPSAIISIGFMVLVTGVYSVLLGTLQGLKNFFAYSFVPLLSIAVRFAVSVILIGFGWELKAVLQFLFISMALPSIFAYFSLRGYLSVKPIRPKDYNIKSFFAFLGISFLAYLFMNFFINSDVLLIKSFDSTTNQAGVYSAGMQISKAIIYVAGAIAAVIFPMTAERVAKGEDTRALLKKALLLSGGIAVIGAVAINLLGEFAISLIFGDRYLDAVPMLLPMSIFAVGLTLLTIMFNYSIALGSGRFFSLTMILGGLILSSTVFFFHDTVTQTMLCMSLSVFVVLAINIPRALMKKNIIPIIGGQQNHDD